MAVAGDLMLQRFPDGFSWGATAVHQVEGGNVNSDGWVLEHLPHTLFGEPSGDACDFLHRYPGDVAASRPSTTRENLFRMNYNGPRSRDRPPFSCADPVRDSHVVVSLVHRLAVLLPRGRRKVEHDLLHASREGER